ncbi:hypothetical protein FLL57_07340 [Rhodopseudomonas palustris]|nr:hypothetical protein FLL57_07340 [Rhodopseudomonas palustris]
MPRRQLRRRRGRRCPRWLSMRRAALVRRPGRNPRATPIVPRFGPSVAAPRRPCRPPRRPLPARWRPRPVRSPATSPAAAPPAPRPMRR